MTNVDCTDPNHEPCDACAECPQCPGRWHWDCKTDGHLRYRILEFDESEMGWTVMTGEPGTMREHMVAWVPDLLGPTDERRALAVQIAKSLNEWKPDAEGQ